MRFDTKICVGCFVLLLVHPLAVNAANPPGCPPVIVVPCPPVAAGATVVSPPSATSIRGLFEENVARRAGGPIYIDANRFSLTDVLRESPQPIVRIEASAQTQNGSHFVRFLLFTKSAYYEIGEVCTDRHLRAIAQNSSVEKIQLLGSDVTDAGVAALGALPNLKILEVHSTVALTDTAVSGLASCHKLEQVHLDQARLSRDAGRVLAGLPALYALKLSQGELSAEVVGDLGKSPTLKRVEFEAVKFPPGALANLRSLTKLAHLTATNATLNAADWEALRQLTSLSGIVLSGTNLRDEHLAGWEKLTELAYLDVTGTAVTSAGLSQLRKNPKLKSFNGDGLAISEGEQQRLANEYGWCFSGACSCGCLDIAPQK